MVLSYIALIELKYVPSIPNLSRAFYHEGMVDFVKALAVSVETIHVNFALEIT